MQFSGVLAGGVLARLVLAAGAIEGEGVITSGDGCAIGAGSGDVRPMDGGFAIAAS